MKLKTKWVKLRLRNNWGRIYYCDEEGNEVEFPDKNFVKVKWEDGTTSELRTIDEDHYETVYDHGHSYSTGSKYRVAIDWVNGTKTKFRLDKFKRVEVKG